MLADIAAQGLSDANVVNLGDHVTGPMDARRTADLLMRRSFVTIRGDQDRRLVELSRQGQKRIDLDTLSPHHIEWLADQPETLLWQADDVLLCHGSPTNGSSMWLDSVSATGQIVATPLDEVEAGPETKHGPYCIPGPLTGHYARAPSLQLYWPETHQ